MFSHVNINTTQINFICISILKVLTKIILKPDFNIIIDSHVVARKNAERFCVPFYIGFSNGNTLQNYHIASEKLILNQ